MKSICLILAIFTLTGCSMFGHSDVEIAPYKVIVGNDENNIQVRRYELMVLVSAPMQPDMDARKNTPFSKLFDYISGNNVSNTEISMTTPVLFNDKKRSGRKIPMTAPVFMEAQANTGTMSFVMPANYTIESTPKPKDPDLVVTEIRETTYAVIQFSGLLSSSNIAEHRKLLEDWIRRKDLVITGQYKAAGYNPPFTIPAFRRNEVLIPVRIL